MILDMEVYVSLSLSLSLSCTLLWCGLQSERVVLIREGQRGRQGAYNESNACLYGLYVWLQHQGSSAESISITAA